MKWKQFSEQLPTEFYDSVQRTFNDTIQEKRIKELENQLLIANQRIDMLKSIGNRLQAWCSNKQYCEEWDKEVQKNV